MKLLFFIITIFPILLNAQSKKIDSLLKVYQLNTADSNKVKALNNLFTEYRYADEDLATKYVNLSIDFASKTKDIKGFAMALYNKGVFEGEHGNLDSSDFYISKSIIQYQKINNISGISNCKMAFGFNMYDKADFTEALSFFLGAVKLKENIKDLKGQAAAYVWIGNIYNSGLNKPSLALPYFQKALAIQAELKDESNMAYTYNNIGNAYYFQKKYPEALTNYLKSAEIKERLNNKKGLASSFDNIGNVYFDLVDYKKAEDYYLRALKIKEEFGDKKGINTSYVNIGNLFFKQKKYNEAIEIHTKALANSKEINNKEGMRESANSLSASHQAIGNLAKALEYYKYSVGINDSIINTDFNYQIAEMQTKYDVEKKDLELEKNKADIEIEKNKRFITYGALAFFIILFTLAIWAFNQKRKSGKLLETKNSQLENANQLITHQKEELGEKQKEILDSIYYAKKIQNALLASEELLLKNLLDHFILFKPKDIVSGDFTWATIKDNLFYIACCDSTGHGVPGAFMSLLNIGFLSEAIKERNITEPEKIFDYVRSRLIETIGNDHQKDGFDGILICIDINTKHITYAAANNSPILIHNEEIIFMKANKMPVGEGIKTDPFDTIAMNYKKGDTLYLYTDGYPDQFGGPKGKKFKYKQLEELLKLHSNLPMGDQKETLDLCFEQWRGDLEQVDDVCIVGITL